MKERLISIVIKHAEEFPDKTAIYTPEASITYRELANHIKSAACWLKSQQVNPADHIMVQAGASLVYVVNYLAIHYLGAVAVPVDKNATLDSVLLMKDEMAAKLFLAESPEFFSIPFARNGKEAYSFPSSPDIQIYQPESLEELSDLLFTTGTTGKSKGVMISHRAILGGISNVKNGTRISQADTLLIPVPLNHSFGLRELRTVLYIGASAVLLNGFAFASALANNIKKYNCTCLTCVPAAIRVLYQQSKGHLHDVLGDLRYIEFCTAPLDLEMKQILLKDFPHTVLLNSYGSTESAGAVYLNFSSRQDKMLSIGKNIDGTEVKIINDDNQTILQSSRENPGRLAIRGLMNMSGYWNAPDITSEVLSNGWVYTNDIAYIDNEGYIFLLGRANDVINVGGKKVSPVEVENTAILFPSIQECCCISAEDPRKILGNIPVLFVVVSSDINMQAFKEFLAAKLETYKLPADIIVTQEIPKNYMGKTDRKLLKKMYEDR